jgi:hypothetical protein
MLQGRTFPAALRLRFAPENRRGWHGGLLFPDKDCAQRIPHPQQAQNLCHDNHMLSRLQSHSQPVALLFLEGTFEKRSSEFSWVAPGCIQYEIWQF